MAFKFLVAGLLITKTLGLTVTVGVTSAKSVFESANCGANNGNKAGCNENGCFYCPSTKECIDAKTLCGSVKQNDGTCKAIAFTSCPIVVENDLCDDYFDYKKLVCRDCADPLNNAKEHFIEFSEVCDKSQHSNCCNKEGHNLDEIADHCEVKEQFKTINVLDSNDKPMFDLPQCDTASAKLLNYINLLKNNENINNHLSNNVESSLLFKNGLFIGIAFVSIIALIIISISFCYCFCFTKNFKKGVKYSSINYIDSDSDNENV